MTLPGAFGPTDRAATTALKPLDPFTETPR